MQKNYYAIIPATIRYDKQLSPTAKLLYGELTALSNEKGYCWASNRYFSELYGVSPISISRYISQLKKLGYIRITYDKNTKDQDRRIYINDLKTEKETTEPSETEEIDTNSEDFTLNKNDNTTLNNFDTINKNVNDPYQNCNLPLTKTINTLNNFVKHNNTVNITTSNTESIANSVPKSPPALSDFEIFTNSFLDYYARLTGSMITDLAQIPYFRNFRNREELENIFEARRFNYAQCLKRSFEVSENRPPERRFFIFYDTLKVYLSNGNGDLIDKRTSLTELETLKKQIDFKQLEAEIIAEQQEIANSQGLSLDEYLKKSAEENERALEEFKKSVAVGV